MPTINTIATLVTELDHRIRTPPFSPESLSILESARMEALAHIHLDRTLGLVAEAKRREVICRILRSIP